MNSPLLKRLVSLVIALLLLTYIGYQIYNAHYSPIRTETATYAEASNTIQANGIAIRQETIVPGKTSGVIDDVIPNGGKVAKGGRIALVYDNPQSAASQQQLLNLNAEISKLQTLALPGDTYAASVDTVNKQIELKLLDLLGQVNSCNFSGLSESRKDFLYDLNERQVVTGQAPNFSARIAALQGQRAALSQSNSQPVGSIAAPAPGYFINTTDGFEKLFQFESVPNLTPAEIKAGLGMSPAVTGDTIGKICSSYNWYFVFVLPDNQVSQIRLDDTVSIQFPFASSEAIPATVVSVNKTAAEAAVILRSNYMNASIASIRKQTAQIETDSYSGIRVSQKAVHFETVSKSEKGKNGKITTIKKNVKGVYVLHGSEILFKEIKPLYSNENYVICDQNPSEDDLMTDTTVKLSDEVVVEGTDLFDGKVVK
ncbi:MAG TPA: HlyD family efflux transporter periplasmic adaptor subunit [Caproiciproducens sp.]|nr:HlyD family efflux transporter periplasmic adaptor subunit [Caproiciproducens sp.]